LEIGPRRERHEVVVALISFFFSEEEGRRQRHTLDELESRIKYDGWNIMQRRRKGGRERVYIRQLRAGREVGARRR
jgi:hypothetical protein